MTSRTARKKITEQDKGFMCHAIRVAEKGVRAGQSPFGAIVVKDHKIVGSAHNAVWKNKDITAHAEMIAIRKACKKLKTVDLSGCVIYSTCEPCPMCFTAIHWARISKVFFGSAIRDALGAGFNEFRVSNVKLKKLGKSPVKIIPGVLRDENMKVFRKWLKRRDRRVY